MFPGEGKVKMSVEEQIDRMRRHQSGSMKEKRRSLQLPASPAPDPATRPAYKVVMSSRRPTDMAQLCPQHPLPVGNQPGPGAVGWGAPGENWRRLLLVRQKVYCNKHSFFVRLK